MNSRTREGRGERERELKGGKTKDGKIKEMNSNTYTEYYCREVEILHQWGIFVAYTQLGCKAMGSLWKLPSLTVSDCKFVLINCNTDIPTPYVMIVILEWYGQCEDILII